MCPRCGDASSEASSQQEQQRHPEQRSGRRMGMIQQTDGDGKSRLKTSRHAKPPLSREGMADSPSHRRGSADRIYVDHTYRDHLYDPSGLLQGGDPLDPNHPADCRKKGPRGGVTITFPEKLHIMLQACAEEGMEHVVSWLPHGRSFLVHQKNEFVEDIMPRFFHQSKMTSFQRQLNLYGFVRLTAGKDRGAYYHELFLRSRPDLCPNMTRTRVKGNGMKAASSPQTEPNFYAMEPSLEVTAVVAAAAAPIFPPHRRASLCDGSAATATALVSRSGESASTSFDDDDSEDDGDDDDLESVVAPALTCLPDVGPMPSTQLSLNSLLLRKIPSAELFFGPTSTPALVSPASTPQQADCRATIALDWSDGIYLSSALSVMDVLDGWSTDNDDDEKDADSYMDIPHSGDEVFFEGSKFHYLDRIDVGFTPS